MKQNRKLNEWIKLSWFSWAIQQVKNLSIEEIESGYKLALVFASMSITSINNWLGHFTLEARTISGKEYSPYYYIMHNNFVVGYNKV